MTFTGEFQDARDRALVENTAQDVFNILRDVENQATLHASRWIWELLQNARDAALPDLPLRISVTFAEDQVTFQHNGALFTMDQVAHLIYHGSTKHRDGGDVGRFGTGFLSTHIISKKPHVSGCLDDDRRFAFVLDRTGASPEELTDSMNQSSRAFIESIRHDVEDISNYSTRYVYPLTADVATIAEQGVQSLQNYAPYVLAFNHEIESIEIDRSGEKQTIQARTK